GGTARAVPELEAECVRTTAVPFAGTDFGLKIAALPSDLPLVLDAVTTAATARSLTPRLAGRAATAVLFVGVPNGDDEARAGFLEALRQRLLPRGAHVVVVHAAPDLKRRLDVWGPVSALPLMRRVKARFDPDSTLSPGRFVGGLGRRRPPRRPTTGRRPGRSSRTASTAASASPRVRPIGCGARRWTRRAGASTSSSRRARAGR